MLVVLWHRKHSHAVRFSTTVMHHRIHVGDVQRRPRRRRGRIGWRTAAAWHRIGQTNDRCGRNYGRHVGGGVKR